MTEEQIMETLNAQFKDFFSTRGFKVKKDRNGMKATKEDVLVTFYIGYGQFAYWYREDKQVDSAIWAKIPYTNYDVARYTFKLDTAVSNDVLNKVFTDDEFLSLFDFEIPVIRKKLI
jgi:hypothetical protein